MGLPIRRQARAQSLGPLAVSQGGETDTLQPWAAVMMRNKAKNLGLPCVALGGGTNQLPRAEKEKMARATVEILPKPFIQLASAISLSPKSPNVS